MSAEIEPLPATTETTPPKIITPKYSSLLEYGAAILQSKDSTTKCNLTFEAKKFFLNHNLPVGDQIIEPNVKDIPARPDNLIVVHFSQVIGRVKGDSMELNRIRMIHQQAHIESYAVDLSWDILVRFANYKCIDGTLLPRDFFLDWLYVADDEARHFQIWEQRLIDLGSFYGEHPTHDALWESAITTKHDLLARLAVVHLIHEAHGLDCGDRLLNQFLGMRDKKSADFFRAITRDEVKHVAAGFKWYNYIADRIVAGGKYENGQDWCRTDEEKILLENELRKRYQLKINSEQQKEFEKEIHQAEQAATALQKQAAAAIETSTKPEEIIPKDDQKEDTPEQEQKSESQFTIPLESQIQTPKPIILDDKYELFYKIQEKQKNNSDSDSTKKQALCPLCPDFIFNPIFHFHHLVQENFHGAPRPPFNHELRQEAGMTPEWYEPLAKIKPLGERLNVKQLMQQRKAKLAADSGNGNSSDVIPPVTGNTNRSLEKDGM